MSKYLIIMFLFFVSCQKEELECSCIQVTNKANASRKSLGIVNDYPRMDTFYLELNCEEKDEFRKVLKGDVWYVDRIIKMCK